MLHPTTPTDSLARAKRHAAARKVSRGSSTLEEILTIAAVLGCFVYPMSVGARAAGKAIAQSIEAGHTTILTQR